MSQDMAVDLARLYADIVRQCAANPAVSEDARKVGNESVTLLMELARLLGRLANDGPHHSRGFEQWGKYQKIVDARQLPWAEATRAMLACAATIVTTSAGGPKGSRLLLGDAASSGVDELRVANAETRALLDELRGALPPTLWERLRRLFGGAKAPGSAPGAHRGAACSKCGKAVRPFAHPKGAFVGTLAELADVQIEPDHALVCSACGAVACPVCLGQEAGRRGLRQFVCTGCGHSPVNTIYRG